MYLGEAFLGQSSSIKDVKKTERSTRRPICTTCLRFFEKNMTKSDFERAPDDISATPEHLHRSQGRVWDLKNKKIEDNVEWLVVAIPPDHITDLDAGGAEKCRS